MEIAQMEDGTYEVDGNLAIVSTIMIEGHIISYVEDSDGKKYPVFTPGAFEKEVMNFRTKLINALANPDLYQGD